MTPPRTDPAAKVEGHIPREHLHSVCRPGHEADTCMFITVGGNGFECAKGTELEATIRRRQASMSAQGDNCPGMLAVEEGHYRIIRPTAEFPHWFVYDSEYPDEGSMQFDTEAEAQAMCDSMNTEDLEGEA